MLLDILKTWDLVRVFQIYSCSVASAIFAGDSNRQRMAWPQNPQFARLLQCTKLSVILTTLVETDLVGRFNWTLFHRIIKKFEIQANHSVCWSVAVEFCLLMSIVSSLFVRTVNLLTLGREGEFANIFYSKSRILLAPLVFVLTAALLVHFTRTLFKVTKWQGPADSIYAAHRTDNELNIKSGLASTLAALISAVELRLDNMVAGPFWGDYGQRGSSIVSWGFNNRYTIGCGVAGAIAAGLELLLPQLSSPMSNTQTFFA